MWGTNEISSNANLDLKKEVRAKDIGLGVINIKVVVLQQIWQNLGKGYIWGGSRKKISQRGSKKTKIMSSHQAKKEKFQEGDSKLVLNIAREVKRALRTSRVIWQIGSHWWPLWEVCHSSCRGRSHIPRHLRKVLAISLTE